LAVHFVPPFLVPGGNAMTEKEKARFSSYRGDDTGGEQIILELLKKLPERETTRKESLRWAWRSRPIYYTEPTYSE